jgi:DNA-binding response OmpR family regulator
MKVLVIDDAEDMRFLTRLCLSAIGGMQVLTASSGCEGLQLAEIERPDCILLDVMLPDIDGLATLESLRGNAKTANIPVIFITGEGVTVEKGDLEGSSAIGVITTPFDPAALPSRVRALLAAGT